jgi:hypothetical protein
LQSPPCRSLDPCTCNGCSLSHKSGLGSSAFARHYLRNHSCFLFLRVLRCFSSPGCLDTPMDSVHRTGPSRPVGSPIRTSTHQRSLTAPRGISVFAPSFFGSWHLGIPRAPFLPSPVSTAALRHMVLSLHSLFTHVPLRYARFIARSFLALFATRRSFGEFPYISQCVTPRDAVTQSRCRYAGFRPKTSPNTTNTVFLRRYRRITFVISFPRYSLSSPFPHSCRFGSLKTKHTSLEVIANLTVHRP